MILRFGVHTVNRYRRVFREGMIKSTYAYRDRVRGVTNLAQMRCNNCKGVYWLPWGDETLPHYCPKCRKQLRALWCGKYWDDESDDIPF